MQNNRAYRREWTNFPKWNYMGPVIFVCRGGRSERPAYRKVRVVGVVCATAIAVQKNKVVM